MRSGYASSQSIIIINNYQNRHWIITIEEEEDIELECYTRRDSKHNTGKAQRVKLGGIKIYVTHFK